jgi:hypothetical protein
MISNHDEPEVWTQLPGGEYTLDPGDDGPVIRVSTSGENVDVRVGSRSGLHIGGRWRVVVERDAGPQSMLQILNSGRGLDLSLPPRGSTVSFLVLVEADARLTRSEDGDLIHLETDGDVRLEILSTEGPAPAVRPSPDGGRVEQAGGQDAPQRLEPDARSLVTLYEDELDVHYGFFGIAARDTFSGDIGEAREGQANGLCGARVPGELSCVTGLHTGLVPLRIDWVATAPPIDPQWEDVVEVSVEFRSRTLGLSSFEDGAALELPESGWHRVRYSVSGMDNGRLMDTPDVGESAPDRYLIQLWPAAPKPDQVVSSGSETAAYWHRVACGQAT